MTRIHFPLLHRVGRLVGKGADEVVGLAIPGRAQCGVHLVLLLSSHYFMLYFVNQLVFLQLLYLSGHLG